MSPNINQCYDFSLDWSTGKDKYVKGVYIGKYAEKCMISNIFPVNAVRAVARALIEGEGEVNIHNFEVCPTNFIGNRPDFKRN